MPKIELKKIKIDDGVYADCFERGETVTDYFERVDPSENYLQDKQLSKLDAFQRQLLVRGIKTSDKFDVMLTDPTNRVLIPELIKRSVLQGGQGAKNAIVVDEMVGSSTVITGSSETLPYWDDSDLDSDTHSPSRTVEGSSFPVSGFKLNDTATTLNKYGRSLRYSYELDQNSAIDTVQLAFYQVGRQWSRDIVNGAMAILLNEAETVNSNTSGTITFKDIIKLDLLLGTYYSGDFLVANMSTLENILGLKQYSEFPAYATNPSSGTWPNPLGLNLRRHDSSLLDNKILSFDSKFALHKVWDGKDLVQEAEKIIANQTNEVTISTKVGFGKIFPNAVKVLNIVHA